MDDTEQASQTISVNMKAVIAVVALICLAELGMTKSEECVHACTHIRNPICGMQVSVERKQFPNACVMERENKCHGGRYVPCTDVDEK